MIRFLFFILNLIGAAASSSVHQCSSVFEQKFRSKVNLEVWDSSQFSDPKQHQVGSEFAYIVSGLTDLSILDKGVDIGVHKPLLFTSLITEKHPRPFYGRVGVILSVKPSNIGGTSSFDTTSTFIRKPGITDEKYVQESIKEYRKKYSTEGNIASLLNKQPNLGGLLTPKNILSKTGATTFHNEILLAGVSNDGNVVSVIGLFYCSKDGKPKDTKDVQIVQEYAKKLGVPAVEIDLTDWYARNSSKKLLK